MQNHSDKRGRNAIEGEEFHSDFREDMSYGDYLQLDSILSAQKPLSTSHDEMLFIVIHQATELWMKLMLHEMGAALSHIKEDDLGPAFKMLARVSRVQEQLLQSWTVLSTMTPADYMTFRESLGRSSGFQSYQYRSIEFILGNKVAAMIEPHRGRPQYDNLMKLYEAPSLYDEVIKLLVRRGLDIDKDAVERDYTQARKPNESVHNAWLQVYRDTEKYWDLYELGEELVDLEESFQTWRFRHATVVERVIGNKRGTGGTSGVDYLKRALDIRFFPELWAIRTEL